MARVSQCCCGCSLKTGSIIIGVLSALGALSAIVNSIRSFGAPLMTPEMAKELNITEEVRESYNTLVSASSHINIAAFIIMAVQLILSVMLVYGANSEKPGLVRPWVIFSIICLVLSSIVYFILMIIFFVYVNVTAGVILLIALIIYMALTSYFIIVVNSFFHELSEGRTIPSKI